ncbi:DNA polymerase IV [Aliivibrio fischeri]|uniref:DNA polymerase IV n=1 Tax=Aliivibrio fischeri TaxID=668 RepID=UPI00080E4145|nr:DNA polymerase IV [Aliivibrio fischeri]OCH01838.1 DNA polymerase IV [Aliivibrio fischeri]
MSIDHQSPSSKQVTRNQKIIHIDMDCFYAAVEMRDNPSLRNVPLAVGGHERQRGVLSTCNYEARKFGIRSAMPTGKALKLCPNLVVVPGRMQVYKEVSHHIHRIFRRYTDKIEPLSLDEAYLDVSDCSLLHGSATLIAEQIRKDIFNELQLTASAGIAPLKFLAKIASDLNKPNGQYVITPDSMMNEIKGLPLEKIPGVGKVSLERLHQFGLYTCEDIQKSDQRDLLLKFGKMGASLWKRSHGIDEREVVTERNRKSVGVERTFTHNISSFNECWDIIENRLFPELEKRLLKANGSTFIAKQGIKIKFADFQQTTIEHVHHNLTLPFFKELLEEVLERQKGREIRLIGLSVMLKEKEYFQQLQLI